MRIKHKITQYRRDFDAVFECEHCGLEIESGGYDDANFHINVIPNMACPECLKTADKSYKPMPTKYPEGYQI